MGSERFDGPILIGERVGHGTVEVCRSFSYKLNLANHGGPQYESVDLFCSRKMSCDAEAAAMVSQEIYEDCVAEVRAAVTAFKAEMVRKANAQRERRTA